MGISSSMQTGVTALAANAVALGSISNNIANVNTTGYKRVITQFADLVSGQSLKNSYSGSGVSAVTQQTVANKGELVATSSGYNLGIDGQGFFVVSDQPDQGSNVKMLFTRDGSFTTDTSGYLVNAAGLYLKGWNADETGTIATSSTDVATLGPINVGNVVSPRQPTTEVAFTSNLDSRTTISDAAATYAPGTAAQSLSAWLNDPTGNSGVKPDATITMKVSDALGQSHNITLALIKTGADANGTTWGYEAWSEDIVEADGDVAGDATFLGQIASGTLHFDNQGNLDLAGSTTGAGAFNSALTVDWAPQYGVAAGQSISLGLTAQDPASTLSSNASETVTTAMKADGTEFGTLSKVEIGDDGTVTAIYNNGNMRVLAKVALATFVNANGLSPISGNAYTVSTTSGTFLLKTPGESGAGFLEASTLESSTVDLSQEFTGLITTQRAYSAASRIITTADEMLQELLQIKR